jgi:hypothetical protein
LPPGAGVPFDLGGGPIGGMSNPGSYFASPAQSFTKHSLQHNYSNAGSVERNAPQNEPDSPHLRPHAAPGGARTPGRQPASRNGPNGYNGAASGSGGRSGQSQSRPQSASRSQSGGQNGTKSAGQNGTQSAAAKKKVNYYEILGVPQDAKGASKRCLGKGEPGRPSVSSRMPTVRSCRQPGSRGDE